MSKQAPGMFAIIITFSALIISLWLGHPSTESPFPPGLIASDLLYYVRVGGLSVGEPPAEREVAPGGEVDRRDELVPLAAGTRAPHPAACGTLAGGIDRGAGEVFLAQAEVTGLGQELDLELVLGHGHIRGGSPDGLHVF